MELVGGRHDVDAGRGLIHRRHEEIRKAERQQCARQKAGDDLQDVPPQQVEYLYEIDLFFCLCAVDGRRIECLLFLAH